MWRAADSLHFGAPGSSGSLGSAYVVPVVQVEKTFGKTLRRFDIDISSIPFSFNLSLRCLFYRNKIAPLLETILAYERLCSDPHSDRH